MLKIRFCSFFAVATLSATALASGPITAPTKDGSAGKGACRPLPFYAAKGGFKSDVEAFSVMQTYIEMLGNFHGPKESGAAIQPLVDYSNEVCWALWDLRMITKYRFEESSPTKAEEIAKRRHWPLPKGDEVSADYVKRILKQLKEKSP